MKDPNFSLMGFDSHFPVVLAWCSRSLAPENKGEGEGGGVAAKDVTQSYNQRSEEVSQFALLLRGARASAQGW